LVRQFISDTKRKYYITSNDQFYTPELREIAETLDLLED